MPLELPLIDVFGRGGALKSSWYGDCLPSRDFPTLVELHLQGRLPLERFVTETIGLDDVEAAFDKMHARRGPAFGGRAVTAEAPVEAAGTARVEHLVTSGVFSLDGQDFEVDNNVWLVGDDDEVVVIDASHDAEAILTAVGARRLVAVVMHPRPQRPHRRGRRGRRRHRRPGAAAPRRPHAVAGGPPRPGHRTTSPTGRSSRSAGVELQVLHTPGHAPGAVCLYAPALGVLFSGDTLFQGGPGATGRSFSSFPTILDSIRERLLTLPPQTRVLTGHGQSTTIGAEAGGYDDWVARGH